MNFSHHALVRAQQRSIPIGLAEFIYLYGEPVKLNGDRTEYRIHRKQSSVLISELKRMIKFIEKGQKKVVITSSTTPTVITVINKD